MTFNRVVSHRDDLGLEYWSYQEVIADGVHSRKPQDIYSRRMFTLKDDYTERMDVHVFDSPYHWSSKIIPCEFCFVFYQRSYHVFAEQCPFRGMTFIEAYDKVRRDSHQPADTTLPRSTIRGASITFSVIDETHRMEVEPTADAL